jgi:uracil-DNA glycosylase
VSASLFSILSEEWQSELSHLRATFDAIDNRLSSERINPERENIFRALSLPIAESRVVIIGQDPYPNSSDACGLAFALPLSHTSAIPPTLKNILRELRDDIGASRVTSGDLTPWVEQGVVLLNRILTTRMGESLAHAQYGWQSITDAIVNRLVRQGAVFLLWGNFARELAPLIPEHQRIEAPHPSPLSAYRGFFGSKPFSSVNQYLQNAGQNPIDW